MKVKIALFVGLTLFVCGCYSFTGASIPAHIHSIAVPLAEDLSGFAQSEVRQSLTDILTQKFTNEGSLQIASRSNADAILEATITRITDEPTGVRGGEQLTNKRVTILVEALYRDQKKQQVFWKRDFSQSAEYPISQNLAGLKTALTAAEEKLADELLLAVISNW